MKFTIISVLNKLPKWVQELSDEYLKRINHKKYSLKIIDIKSSNPINANQKILSYINPQNYIIALDETGIAFSSKDFANKLKSIEINNAIGITFIIGGADGLCSSIKDNAHLVLQLSQFTFPHHIAKILLLEQIYRSITILENHPYHRE